MMYELWHIASGNLLEDFETESDALDAVRGYVEANGHDMLEELSLSAVPTMDSEIAGSLPPPLRGDALARRAGLASAAIEAPGEAGAPDEVGADDLSPPHRANGMHRSSTDALSTGQRRSQ